MEIELVVASKEVLKSYPEVYHYTDRCGFDGILTNNTLWATHYADLNDTTEIRLLREPLVEATSRAFTALLRDRARTSLRIKRGAEKAGGIVKSATNVARDLVSALYETSFDRPDGNNLADPFITSLCSHADAYENRNGLLSQWRAYGGSGGYCIVFDTERLAHMLNREQDKNYYVMSSIWPVIYAHEEVALETSFPELITRFNEFFEGILNRDDLNVPIGDGFIPFVKGVTLFKHQGFREEAEVRLIAIPGTNHAVELMHKEHPNHDFGAIKEVHTRSLNAGGTKRYVILFDGLVEPLPIKRVIVGPSRQQQENADWARTLLGSTVPVELSETPYIPPAS